MALAQDAADDAASRPAPSFLAAYLGPLAGLIEDPAHTEISLNPDGTVWVERQGSGRMARVPDLELSPNAAENLATSIASEAGAVFSKASPLVSTDLTHGGRALRAQIVAPPATTPGPAISFRAFGTTRRQLHQISLLHGRLVDLDADRRARAQEVIARAEAGALEDALEIAVADRLNIIVSGGTDTGKTTLAAALLDLVPSEERIVTIEDAYELAPTQPNRISLRATRKDGETSPARLLEASLRLRPDRIVLGELRGAEAATFLDAINTGHAGSITTIHADTAKKAIDRLALMVLATGTTLTLDPLKAFIGGSIDLILQVARTEDGRRGVAEMWMPGMED